MECEPLVDKIDEKVIEAALFSAGRPLSFEEIRDALGISQSKFDKLFKSLRKQYRDTGSSLELEKIGNKYVLQLKAEYGDFIRSLATREIPMKLLKTIALVAFHQPLKQSDLKRMIGPKVYDHVPEMREMGLIRVRKEGRTKILHTTEKFNEYFGIKAKGKDKKELRKVLAQRAGIVLDDLHREEDDTVQADLSGEPVKDKEN